MKYRDLSRILAEVCEFHSAAVEDVKGRVRKRELVDARKMYYYLARELTAYSFKEIGLMLENDHATALYHHRDIKDRIELPFNRQLKDEVRRLTKLVTEDNFKVKLRDSADKIRYHQKQIEDTRKFIYDIC